MILEMPAPTFRYLRFAAGFNNPHFTPGCNVIAPGKFWGSHRTDHFASDSFMGPIPTAFWVMTIRIVFPKRKKVLRMA